MDNDDVTLSRILWGGLHGVVSLAKSIHEKDGVSEAEAQIRAADDMAEILLKKIREHKQNGANYEQN
jgi:hypothetical protein